MAVVQGPRASHTTLECRNVTASLAFYRDVMGLDVNPVGALVGHAWGTTGHYFVPQKVNNHHGLTLDGAPEVIDRARRAALERSDEFRIRRVLPATRQDGSSAFYMQDADTNCWELEVWDDGISPVQRQLALKASKGAH